MARDPEKRARSREMDKIRKRTRRAIARLEREQTKAAGNFLKIRGIREQIAEYEKLLSQLTARGRNRTYTEKGISALETLRFGFEAPRKSKTYSFEDEMARARGGKKSALGSQGKLKVKLFYYATQPLWEGSDPRKRNEAILKALRSRGISTLEQAYSYVMTSDPEIGRVLSELAREKPGALISNTDDGMGTAYYQARRMRYKTDSPAQFIRVQQIEAVKAYGAM